MLFLTLPILSKLKGTLIAIPVLNVYGLINRSRLLPNGTDLNRHFPGHNRGSNAERLAHIFSNEIFAKVDYCINFQTGLLNCSNLPMIQFFKNDLQIKELAEAFHAPVMVQVEPEPGSLQQLAQEQNKPFLNFIAGEAMRFDLRSIKVGIDGVLNIMRKVGMLPEKTHKTDKKPNTVLAEKLIWVTAATSGTNHTKQKLGNPVKRGELLSVIKDPFGTSENINLESPKDGIIVGKNNLPLIHEGDGLFEMAVFPEIKEVTDHFEQWQEQQRETPPPFESTT